MTKYLVKSYVGTHEFEAESPKEAARAYVRKEHFQRHIHPGAWRVVEFLVIPKEHTRHDCFEVVHLYYD